jgi:hypothetical protein
VVAKYFVMKNMKAHGKLIWGVNLKWTLTKNYNINMNEYPDFNDNLYVDLFEIWTELHLKQPENAEQVCKQTIWHNTYIQINEKAFRIQYGQTKV